MINLLYSALVTMMLTTAPGAEETKATAPEPAVSLILGPGKATATPELCGCAHTGGGNIHVTQPSPDTISVTMTGVVVAGGHPYKESTANFAFELLQGFEVVFHSPKVRSVRLVMWARTVGLLRSHCPCCTDGGSAHISTPGNAAVVCGPEELLSLTLSPRSVAHGQNISVHDREGPVWVPVAPGKYTLHQTFAIAAAHAAGLFHKPASAEFAPEPALDGNWIGKREPFHGAEKKDLGFQVILKVVAEEDGNGKKDD